MFVYYRFSGPVSFVEIGIIDCHLSSCPNGIGKFSNTVRQMPDFPEKINRMLLHFEFGHVSFEDIHPVDWI